jgi:hypothetical protein
MQREIKWKRHGGTKITSVPVHSPQMPQKMTQDSTAATQSEDST